MNGLVTLLFLLSVLALAGAADAAITGRVIDAATTEALPGASVTIQDTRVGALANQQGRFIIQTDETDPLILRASYVGYRTSIVRVVANASHLTIALTRTISVLDQTVITASRYEKEAYKVSQPITAAGRDEIQAKGHTLVSDVIRNFPGVDMNDAGPFRARPVIRGLFGTRVLVLVDGERLNDQRDISSFAGVSMSLVDVNEIERVEIVNGPSSVLYGSDAMGGVINIITRKGTFSEKPHLFGSYSGRYASADQQHANRVDVGLATDRIVGSVGFQYRDAHRDYAPPDGWNEKKEYVVFRPSFYDSLNARLAEDPLVNDYVFSRDRLVNSQARVNNYDGKLAFRISDKHRLDFDLGFLRGHDIGYPGVPNDSTPFYFFYPRHDRDNFSLTYTGTSLTNHLARFSGKVYYDKISKNFLTDFLGFTIPAGPGMSITLLTNYNQTEVTKYGANFQEIYAPTPQSNLTFGIDFQREEIDGQVTGITRYTGFGPFPFNDTTVGSSVPKNNWNSLGLFGSGEVNFNPLLVTLGLRFDNFWVNTKETPGYVDDNDSLLPTTSDHYSSLNTSLGLVYSIGDGVNLVGNVGTAYRVPNVVERFYYGSASNRETRPNPEIEPERAITYDFGVKAIHQRANYSLIGFYSDYNNFTQLLNFDSLPSPGPGRPVTPLWRYENLEDVIIYGFEGVIEGNLPNGLYGSLALTYQHGEISSAGQPLFVSPIKGNITAGYRYPKHGLFGEATLRVAGEQNRVPDVAYLDDVPTKSFTVANVTIGFSPFQSVRAALNINNLFDEVFAEPFNARNPDNPIVEPGRNFVLSLTAEF